ncbi:MAG: response regulator transcription factor [Bacteroidales bacterium]|nr:response regulator transcription factor [Bacteroidales bacterium]
MMNKILLVDDDKDVREFLSYNLKKDGYQIHTASNGLEAIMKAEELLPDLILMDVMMPKMDGIEACEEIRKLKQLDNTLIVFLSARNEDYSHIAGYNAGADDYINKPVKPKVLISKINALLRRKAVTDKSKKKLNSKKALVNDERKLIIDTEKYVVIQNKKEIILPKKQFEILALLVSSPAKVFSREEIFNKIWGNDVYISDRTIDVHIRKIREKVGDDVIRTVKGVGYKFIEL